jgi:extracellular factor (EF) 3-hydroxypalmitic acid methyl ester biosynthesis protein
MSTNPQATAFVPHDFERDGFEPAAAATMLPEFSGGVANVEPDPVRRLELVAAGLLQAMQGPDLPGYEHRCAARLHELFAAIDAAEPDLAAEALLARLQLVRRAIGASPLAWRLQNWPRGYAGDYETIEMMCRGDSVGLLTGAARWVEQWALSCPPVQQHRNKIQRQAAMMLDVLLRPRTAPPARVLSIACGPSRDVRALLPVAHACHGEIWLNDADVDALAFSRACLDGSALQCRYLPGNVFRVHKALAASGPFDLVVAGGLFDYLNDRQAVHLLTTIRQTLLVRGGRCFFTNIAAGHAYRACMEYVVNWTLIERSVAQVVALCEAAGISAGCVDVATDDTGLALLVTATLP